MRDRRLVDAGLRPREVGVAAKREREPTAEGVRVPLLAEADSRSGAWTSTRRQRDTRDVKSTSAISRIMKTGTALLLAGLVTFTFMLTALPVSALDLTNSLVVDIIRADAGVTTLLREYIVLNSSINPLSGSPVPPPEGTRGQMVNYDACNGTTVLQPTVFPNEIEYLALVANLSAPCSFEKKLANLVADPLVAGVVFYDYSFPNATSEDWIPPKYANSNVPFYWMDGGLGGDYADLLDRVYKSYPPGQYVGVGLKGACFADAHGGPHTTRSSYPTGNHRHHCRHALWTYGRVADVVIVQAVALYRWHRRCRRHAPWVCLFHVAEPKEGGFFDFAA